MDTRIREASEFIQSFSNSETVDFLTDFLVENYIKAVLTYYPEGGLQSEVIYKYCQRLVSKVFMEIEGIEKDANKLFPIFHKFSRSNPDLNEIWFPEFMEAYRNYKHSRKLVNRYRQLKPYLKGTSYCDMGCGGGDLVAYLLQEPDDFHSGAGIDIMDWRTEKIKELIDFQLLDFSREGTVSARKYDTLTCLAVTSSYRKIGRTHDPVFIKFTFRNEQ